MKRLEELGISPAPWKVGDFSRCVYDAEDYIVHDEPLRNGLKSDRRRSNSRLIAAAPKMYEAGNAAYDSLEGLCPWYGKCLNCLHGYRVAKDGEWLDSNSVYCNKANRANCMVFIALSKLRSALAEASGEVIES